MVESQSISIQIYRILIDYRITFPVMDLATIRNDMPASQRLREAFDFVM
jgi:hypothetical protein